MAFTQTAHSLVPANPQSLMSTRPASEVAKRAVVPISRADVTPAYVPVYTWNGGAFGYETVAETNVLVDDQGRGDYGPRNSVEQLSSVKAGDPSYTRSTIVNSPRGWIDPAEPYGAAPVSPTDDPTLTSIAPTGGVSGGPPIWATLTGTKFTPYSSVESGTVYTPYSRYVSPTRIDVLMDPRSTPGVVTVGVRDHGVLSNTVNFTFT